MAGEEDGEEREVGVGEYEPPAVTSLGDITETASVGDLFSASDGSTVS